MLSDNSEKSRNPLKKAMRRRNAKTVQFAAPTYVEASDYDYSTEDEEQAMIDPYGRNAQAEEAQQNGQAEQADGLDADEEGSEDARESKRASFEREQAATHTPTASVDEPQLSPKLVDKTEAAPLKSRKGTPRNTDSFLKDDGMETKKITITPGLLREDSVKSASSESSRTGSTENLVKSISPTEQRKEIKDKKKEKQKGGMLSGLFKSKKKDKKTKDDPGNESDMEKPSNEYSRESPRSSPRPSGTSSPVDRPAQAQSAATDTRQMAQAKQPPVKGKLQKQQPQSQTSSPAREPVKEAENRAFVAELPGEEVAHEMATDYEASPQAQQQVESDYMQPQQPEKEREGLLSPITNLLSSSDKEPKPQKAKKAKQRVELDDFDTPEDEGPNPFEEQEERKRANSQDQERLSESPVEVMPGTFHPDTFMHGTELVHVPTPGYDEGEEADEDDESPESLTSSPSIIEHPSEPAEERESEFVEDNDPTPTAPRSPQPNGVEGANKFNFAPSRDMSTDSNDARLTHHPSTPSISQQSWSDSSLRAWYDDGSDIKDMLLMIHDKSGVAPVSANHPMMAGLFVEERKGVQKMMGDLDGLLGSYLQRKGISLA